MDCVILAAGKGTRMNSSAPKVLHEVGGKSLIEHLLETTNKLELAQVLVVVGYKNKQVRGSLSDWEINFALQEDQRGTAHALQQAKGELNSESFLVIPGDLPLVKPSSLKKFIDASAQQEAELSLITVERDDPEGYGRIKRDKTGQVKEIIEEKDASEKERKIKEVNTGVYLFKNTEEFWHALESIDSENAQREFYLTDLVKLYHSKGKNVAAHKAGTNEEFLGVNTRRDLVSANNVLNLRKINSLLDSGVTIVDPSSTIIEPDVNIDPDTIIEPFTIIKGKTKIGSNSRIGPNVEIVDGQIGTQVEISHAVVKGAKIRENNVVEPFSFLRPN